MPAKTKKKPAASKSQKTKTVEPAGVTKIAKKPTRQALEDKTSEQAKELDMLRAELAKAQETTEQLRRQSEQVQNVPKKKSPKIPRPKGKYNIREAMRLGNDKPTYNRIMTGVRGLAWRSKLDWSKEFREQPAEELGYVFKVARKQFKYLRTFENDWATADLIAQSMRNRRKTARRQGTLPPAKKGKTFHDKTVAPAGKENEPVCPSDSGDSSSSSDDEEDDETGEAGKVTEVDERDEAEEDMEENDE